MRWKAETFECTAGSIPRAGKHAALDAHPDRHPMGRVDALVIRSMTGFSVGIGFFLNLVRIRYVTPPPATFARQAYMSRTCRV
jgi:hypothetical protein